jgi:hypothetical protein
MGGPTTVKGVPGPGVSILPLSSTARLRIVYEPGTSGVQVALQF